MVHEKKLNKTTLMEGNHRIAWAKMNNIPWVPVKVIHIDENHKNTSIPPSKLGITIILIVISFIQNQIESKVIPALITFLFG